jgi:hypothetical protein
VLRWTVDLADCDRVLRVEARSERSGERICQLLHARGLVCEWWV